MVLDGDIFETEPIDWGMMPSSNTRDMLSYGSRLLVTTDRGLAVNSVDANTVHQCTRYNPLSTITRMPNH